MSTKKQILQWISPVLLLLVFSCAKQEALYDEPEGTNIRILTTIEMGFPSQTKTRAGTVDEAGYEEGYDNGLPNESYVGTVRVIAFDNNAAGNMAANILYLHPDKPISGDLKNYTIVGGTGGNTEIQMDLEILTGVYEFILITNEDASWNLQNITTRTDLQNSTNLKAYLNEIISNADLQAKVTAGSGIPMVGSSLMTIPYAPNASETNPILVPPVINLKRTLAKVEVNLTNQDADNGNVIFEAANVYEIKSVTLKNVNQLYNILESDNRSLTETSNEISAAVTHNTGDRFTGTLIAAYMAERKNVTEANAVIADITVEKLGEEITYSIPIFQTPADKDYSIYRNTLYRLNCILEGTMLKLTLKVDDWTNVNLNAVSKEIDWLNVSRTAVQLTANGANYTGMLHYSSNLAYKSVENPNNLAGLTVAESPAGRLNITLPVSSLSSGAEAPVKLIFGEDDNPAILSKRITLIAP